MSGAPRSRAPTTPGSRPRFAAARRRPDQGELKVAASQAFNLREQAATFGQRPGADAGRPAVRARARRRQPRACAKRAPSQDYAAVERAPLAPPQVGIGGQARPGSADDEVEYGPAVELRLAVCAGQRHGAGAERSGAGLGLRRPRPSTGAEGSVISGRGLY